MGQALRNTRQETHLCLRGQLLTPLPEGGLWWEAERTLIVSDLHLEKGSSYAAGGQMLPPYDTAATLTLVEQLAEAWSPQRIISLGDSFHDRQAEFRLDENCVSRIRALTNSVDWVWVEGNHDPDPPQHLGGRASKVLRIGDLVFRHEPSAECGEIAGHLHPCAKIVAKGRALRRKCFVSDGERLVMPSMGAFTGGLNVLNEAFVPVFPEGGLMVVALGSDQVYPVSMKRLLPDGPRKGGAWKLKADGSS